MKLSGYPKVYNMGHPVIEGLLLDDVLIEEKVDGSQFSFGVVGGEVFCRSKGTEQYVESPDKMFEMAVATVLELRHKLLPDTVYRGEYLQKPKHNVLAYDRTPEKHIILFDVDNGHNAYRTYEEKAAEASRIGLEVVPKLFEGRLTSVSQVMELLERVSVLGGNKIEGFVIKNYTRFGRDGKAMMGKHVSEKFKEKHGKDWKAANPGGKDILQTIGDSLRTEARWEKAVQHLRERDAITDSPKDIGRLIKEVHADLKEECEEEVAIALMKWAWPKISRRAAAGIPEWYKNRLMEKQLS
jgi:hypothetical protein